MQWKDHVKTDKRCHEERPQNAPSSTYVLILDFLPPRTVRK